MPKVKAKVRSHKIEDGKLFVTLEFNERIPKIAETVTVKWGAVRTHAQNALYWTFLTWCIDHGGLKRQGHFCPEALHMDLKAFFLSEKTMTKGQFKALDEATTTDLGKAEFGEYMDKVSLFMQEFFQVDTEAFWKENRERNGE